MQRTQERRVNITRKPICGNAACECSRIMAHLDLIKTPYFTVTNPDKRLGPTLPIEFVQEHGHELMRGAVVLDTARTAGKILTVQFVKELEDEETPGAVKRLCIAQPGWERFVTRNKLVPEDLLFFTLQQGQSRFIVMMLAGHSRRKDVDRDLEEGTAEMWRAAQIKRRGNAAHQSVSSAHEGKDEDSSAAYAKYCISSDDAPGSYPMLSDDSDDSSDGEDFESECENGTEDCSDFEDEDEFRRNLFRII